MRSRGPWTALGAAVALWSATNVLAQELWIYRYDGPGNFEDAANSIVAGADGNTYAAGLSYGSETEADFIVVSLTPSGQEHWLYRYNGPGNGYDRANSIVADTDGNLYIAGFSYGSGTSRDFTVVSLTTAGRERWVYDYNGPANSSDGATSIIVGTDGNLYAAGASKGDGTGDDFTVISLTSMGTERWVYRYNGPGDDVARSIVMGSDENLYAAGYAGGIEGDFAVASLTPSGRERWVVHCCSGVASSIVMGSDGNLYVAGFSYGSGTSRDFTVASLTAAGGERWVYGYNGPGNSSDGARSIIMGTDGNLYAAGSSWGSGTQFDFTVIKLTPSGGECWVYRYDGPGSAYDRASSIAMGTDDNLYVAGSSWGSGTSYDLIVISLSPTEGERWVYRYNGPGDVDDAASSIVAGTEGNLYVAGSSCGSGTSQDFTVVSLTPDVGIEEAPEARGRMQDAGCQLLQISPNPFAQATLIRYHVSAGGRPWTAVNLSIYDLAGRLVKVLFDDLLPTSYSLLPTPVVWDGRDHAGRRVASGIYLCKLTYGDFAATSKMVLLRMSRPAICP